MKSSGRRSLLQPRAHRENENVTTGRGDEDVRQPDRESVGGESVDGPQDRLAGRDDVRDDTYAGHRTVIVAVPDYAPQLRRKLSDIDNRRHVADEDDHGRVRAFVTTVTMRELMTRLTLAATITGMPLVPIP
jgi:hypothetical protein